MGHKPERNHSDSSGAWTVADGALYSAASHLDSAMDFLNRRPKLRKIVKTAWIVVMEEVRMNPRVSKCFNWDEVNKLVAQTKGKKP